MNDESKQRITKTTAACMITVAALFDLAQIAAKLFAPMGIVGLGGALGALICHYANIQATGACVVAGGTAGVAISYIPVIGPVVAAAATMVGTVISELASAAFMFLGYATISLMIMHKGVSIFGGKDIQKKVVAGFIAVIVDVTPLLNLMPGLTLWTIRMILLTRSEDTDKAKTAKTRYNGGKNYSRMRRALRRYVPTKI